MTERPILFSGPMIRAILHGRKTQTRRVLKPQPVPPAAEGGKWHIFNRHGGVFCDEHEVGKMAVDYCPIAEGDELWVRESFADTLGMGFDKRYHYAADVKPDSESDQIRKDYGVKWKPSIHMPRAASRITLRVTAVKVERLQDITPTDCLAEGVVVDRNNYHGPWGEAAVHEFSALWASINGWPSWHANPWVAAYTFERIKP